MPQKFFITHSWKDIDFARKLCNDLTANGLDGFFDERSIRPGESIPKRIEQGLEQCDVYIPVLSPDALKSRWADWEIDMAIQMRQEQGRPQIIPVIAEKCDVPRRLRHILYIDFVGRYNDALNDLLTKGFGISTVSPNSKPTQTSSKESLFGNFWPPKSASQFLIEVGGLAFGLIICILISVWFVVPQFPMGSAYYLPTATLNGSIQAITSAVPYASDANSWVTVQPYQSLSVRMKSIKTAQVLNAYVEMKNVTPTKVSVFIAPYCQDPIFISAVNVDQDKNGRPVFVPMQAPEKVYVTGEFCVLIQATDPDVAIAHNRVGQPLVTINVLSR